MKRPKSVSFWIAFLGFGCFDLYVNAAQRGSPHPHQGKLKPFEPGPPKIKLSSADQSKVDDGELVMRQTVIDGGSSGRATAIQAVHAPPRLVWKQLLDLNSYPSKVDKLTECGKYFEKVRGVDGSKNIKARFLVKAAPGFSFEYYCDHIYSPQKKSLTWTLDYDRDSDFDDVAGHWYVCAHPTRPNWSQVYYSADLALKNFVPGFIMNILTTSALRSAVSWVKKYSEAEWAEEEEKGPAHRGGRFPSFGRGLTSGSNKFMSLNPFTPPPAPTPPPIPKHVRRPLYKRPSVIAAATVAGATAAASVICGIIASEREDAPNAR